MKFILLLAIGLFTLTLNLTAKSTNYLAYNGIDTLKKGKNYLLFSKSKNIESVNFSKNKKGKENLVYIRFGFPSPIPTSNAVNATVITSKRYNEDGSIPIFDKIDILKGKYDDIVLDKDTKVRNLYTLKGVEYPLHLKLTSGNESTEIELTEAGTWDISIELKNN